MTNVDRRTILGGGLGLGAAGLLALAARDGIGVARANENATKPGGVDWNSPAENLRILSRMWGTIEEGVEAYLYVFGPCFGVTDANTFVPLYRIESIAPVKTFAQENGKYRYVANQVIVFTDWRTGEVLEKWKNPFTDETVDVLQYRDGPLDYIIDPEKSADRYDDPTRDAKDISKRRLVLDWYFRDGKAFGDAIVKTTIKNRLDPNVWKRESIGEFWTTFESYRWQGLVSEIADRSLKTVPSFMGDFQTFKPWEPWMLMGQKPGKVFAQKTAMKIADPSHLPPATRIWLEKHMPDFLTTPKNTTPGSTYKLNDAWFGEERKPIP